MNVPFQGSRASVASCAVCLMAFSTGLSGQSGTVGVEENVRAQPNGTLLGRLRPGTVLQVVDSSGDWIHIELSGWVWTQSLQVVGRGDFDLVVSASDGENVRAAPSGDIIGRLEEGTLLQEVERVPGWARVSRRAWIWRRSVELEESARSDVAEAAELTVAEEWTISGAADAAILSSPDGDTLARAVPGSNLRVLAREGNWARVRLDGWLWLPEGTAVDAETTVLADVSVEEVMAEPQEYRGRVLQWDLQFISLERAEKIRTDFYEGEPFLLAKAGRGDGIFVYVAIPPERLDEAQGLSPLERIRVIARVRTGAAALTGSPIVDLLALSHTPR